MVIGLRRTARRAQLLKEQLNDIREPREIACAEGVKVSGDPLATCHQENDNLNPTRLHALGLPSIA